MTAERPASINTLKKEARWLYESCRHHFGSVRKACAAGGIPYDPHASPYSPSPKYPTRALVLDALRARQKEGLAVTTSVIGRSDGPLYSSIRAFFPSHAAAMAAAGLVRILPRHLRPVFESREDAIAAIRQLLEGKSARAIKRRHYRTAEDCAEALRKLADQGHSLYPSRIRTTDPALHSAIRRCFSGDWNAAIDAAGLASYHRQWKKPFKSNAVYRSPEATVEAYRAYIAGGGKPSISATGRFRPALELAIRRFFPDFQQLVKAAAASS